MLEEEEVKYEIGKERIGVTKNKMYLQWVFETMDYENHLWS